MKPLRKLHAKPLFIVILASLLGGCQAEIISNLDQRGARDIERVLLANGIKADVVTAKGGGYAIEVSTGARLQALSIIADAGLPQTEYATIEKMFPGNGLIVTPMEQRARLTYATEQELDKTLASMEGVRSAQVHVAMPEDDGRGFVKQRARAAALIVYRNGAETASIEEKARSLILNSVRNLDFEDVSIVLSQGEDVAAGLYRPAIASSNAEPAPAGSSRGALIAIIAGALLAALGALKLFAPPKRRRRLTGFPGTPKALIGKDR